MTITLFLVLVNLLFFFVYSDVSFLRRTGSTKFYFHQLLFQDKRKILVTFFGQDSSYCFSIKIHLFSNNLLNSCLSDFTSCSFCIFSHVRQVFRRQTIQHLSRLIVFFFQYIMQFKQCRLPHSNLTVR